MVSKELAKTSKVKKIRKSIMANVSLEQIQSWNDAIFADLTDEAKERMLQLGYNNKGNYILMSYLKLLRINLNWTELQELVANIKVTYDKEKYDKIKSEILQITGLDYDDFESEILANINLNNLNYLNKIYSC